MDKVDIGHCDVVFVYYEFPTAGTMMEIPYGWQIGKMVVVVCKDAVVFERLSPWIIHHSHFQCISFEAAIDYIMKYYRVATRPTICKYEAVWS